jgi:proteic killer suppression protein
MEVIFANPELDRLEVDGAYDAGLDRATVLAYRMRLQQIRAAPDEKTLFALRSLDFRHLAGQPNGGWSMALAGQRRLILELEDTSQGRVVLVSAIESERTAEQVTECLGPEFPLKFSLRASS